MTGMNDASHLDQDPGTTPEQFIMHGGPSTDHEAAEKKRLTAECSVTNGRAFGARLFEIAQACGVCIPFVPPAPRSTLILWTEDICKRLAAHNLSELLTFDGYKLIKSDKHVLIDPEVWRDAVLETWRELGRGHGLAGNPLPTWLAVPPEPVDWFQTAEGKAFTESTCRTWAPGYTPLAEALHLTVRMEGIPDEKITEVQDATWEACYAHKAHPDARLAHKRSPVAKVAEMLSAAWNSEHSTAKREQHFAEYALFIAYLDGHTQGVAGRSLGAEQQARGGASAGTLSHVEEDAPEDGPHAPGWEERSKGTGTIGTDTPTDHDRQQNL